MWKNNTRDYFKLLLLLQGIFLAAISPLWAGLSLAERLVSMESDTRASAQQEASTLPVKDQKRLAATLVTILERNDPERSEHAAEALGQLGPAAYGAMPALRKGMGAEFPYVRTRCSEALLRMGAPAIPELTEALKSENLDVRSLASAALEKLGPASQPAVPALVASLDDPASIIQAAAVRALTRIGEPAVPALEEALVNPHFHNRIGAVQTLSNIDPTPPDLADHLVTFLGEGDTQLRMVVIKTLAHKGEASVPALRKVLSSDNPLACSGAAEAISDIGPKAAPAVPELTAALKNSDPRVRRSVVQALGKIGFGAGAAVPALEEATKDSDKEVAVRAAEALVNITVFTKEGKRVTLDKAQAMAVEETRAKAREILAKAEVSAAAAGPRSPGVKSPRVKAAGRAGKLPVKTEAPPRNGPITAAVWLKRCASDEANARLAASRAFAQRGTEAIPTIRQTFDDDDWRLRQCACFALEQLGPLGGQAIGGLNQALRDSSLEVRHNAIQALRAIQSDAAIRSIESATKDSHSAVRLAALSALESLAPAATLSIAPLESCLQDPDDAVKSAAVRVLEKIGSPESRRVLDRYREKLITRRVGSLIAQIRQSSQAADTADITALAQIGLPAVLPVSNLLKDPSARVRRAAARTLGRMGPTAAEATWPLMEALEDPDESVQSEAAEALENIGSPEAKDSLRLYYAKDKTHRLLRKMHLGGN